MLGAPNDVERTRTPPTAGARLRRLGLQILAGAAVVLATETGLRAFDVLDPCERADPYLGFAGTPPLYRRETTPGGSPIYRTAPNKRAIYRDVTFEAVKPERGLRVFCLGGSSVRSDALDAASTFPGYLERGLRILYPDRPVEVVNAGGGGTGSFQYREVAREVRHYDADLIVVYPEAGERKYLPPSVESGLIEMDRAAPARAPARRVLTQWRVYTAIRDGFRAVCPEPVKPAAKLSAFSLAAVYTASGEFAPQAFARIFEFKRNRIPPLVEGAISEELIARAHADFVDNLTSIGVEARNKRIPVVFVDTVRNLKADFYLRFHVDPRDVKPGRLADWRRAYESGLECERRRDFGGAVDAFKDVRNTYVRDRDEILAYHLGTCLEALGRMEEARAEYERAYVRRALRERLKEAAARSGALLVDPYPALVRISPNGIPDSTLFTDAFHPMPRTNAAIAGAILEHIYESNLPSGQKPPRDRLTMALTDVDVAARGSKLDPTKELQSAVYCGNFERAVAIGREKDLSKMLFVEKMYYGYAQTKLGDFDGARRTWLALKAEILQGGKSRAEFPPLRTDADVVRHVFDNDLFSEF